MNRFLTAQRHWILPVLATILIATTGGISVAGNMAFHLIKPIALVGTPTNSGKNWTSIPYLNPYTGIQDFCRKTGLVSTGLFRTTITTLNYNNPTEGYVSYACGAPNQDTPLIPGKGIQIRQPPGAGAPTSIVIYGAHDPTVAITLQAGRLFWYSVPYHTTAVTADDLCREAGLTSSGLSRAQVTRLDGSAGNYYTYSCGTGPSSISNFHLVLGEMVQISEPVGPKTFIPDHF